MAAKVVEKCFVIMPFSKTTEVHTKGYWDNHYEKFLVPLIESGFPLKAERSEAIRGDIIRQIITDLVTAPVVVANLTDSNPNVYWELGVRQSFRHCTITIAEEGIKLPSDIATKGTLFYHPKEYIANEEFRIKFRKAISDCLENPEIPDSHVLETITGRGTLFNILSRDETLRKLKAIKSENDRNKRSLEEINKTVKDNKKKGEEEKKLVGTERLLLPSIELLLVSRYIDTGDVFYKAIESHFEKLFTYNETLTHWIGNRAPTEKWLSESYERMKKRFQTMDTLIEKQVIRINKSI